MKTTIRNASKRCPKCHRSFKDLTVKKGFGFRKVNGKVVRQSWCRKCRNKS